jgi:anti-anti-sigma regulatory factor
VSRPAKRAAKPRSAKAATAAAVPAADTSCLKLGPCCTLRESADLQSSLLAASGNPLVVDGGGVERIDTAGLQLLVALVRRQQQAGRRLEWCAASPELRKCGERLGLIAVLGLAVGGEGDGP